MQAPAFRGIATGASGATRSIRLTSILSATLVIAAAAIAICAAPTSAATNHGTAPTRSSSPLHHTAAQVRAFEPRVPLTNTTIVSPTRVNLGIVAPGSRHSFQVTIHNRRTTTTTYAIQPAAAIGTSASSGTIAYVGAGTPRAANTAASWIHPAVTTTTLKAREMATVTVNVQAPRTLTRAGYYGGVIVSWSRAPRKPARTSLGVREQIALLVMAQTSVTPRPKISLGALAAPTLEWGRHPTTITLPVSNNGNVAVVATGAVTVRAPFAHSPNTTLTIRSPLLLPGSHADAQVRWNRPPVLGLFRMRAAMHAEMPRSSPAAKAPASQGGARKTSSSAITAQHTPWQWFVVLPPWWFLVVIAALILGLIMRNRRRHRGDDDYVDAAGDAHDM